MKISLECTREGRRATEYEGIWRSGLQTVSGSWTCTAGSGRAPKGEAGRVRKPASPLTTKSTSRFPRQWARHAVRIRCTIHAPASLPNRRREDHLSCGWWRHHRPAAAFSVEGLLARIAALLCFLAFASSAFAQPIDNSINAELKDLGKLQTKIQRYNKSLGVVSQFMRSENSYVDCNGLCFFQNGSKNVSWSCGPKKICNLYCSVDPPVGGCN